MEGGPEHGGHPVRGRHPAAGDGADRHGGDLLAPARNQGVAGVEGEVGFHARRHGAAAVAGLAIAWHAAPFPMHRLESWPRSPRSTDRDGQAMLTRAGGDGQWRRLFGVAAKSGLS